MKQDKEEHGRPGAAVAYVLISNCLFWLIVGIVILWIYWMPH